MSYVSEIRQKIGHDMLLNFGAGVIVYHDGKILLQKRADNGCWAIHSGGLEIGETAEEVARRELLEETGLVAGKLDLLGLYSGEDRFITYPNGDQAYVPLAVYICRDFSGKLSAQKEEVSDLQWFGLDELPEELFQTNRRFVTDFVHRIKSEAQK